MRTLATATDLASIRERITLVSPTDTALWGSMSAHQMICHLTDTFRCALGERTVAPFKAWSMPAPVFKWLALYFPRKWPPGVPTTPEMDQNAEGIQPTDFSADSALLLEKLEAFARSTSFAAPHPMWGQLNRTEWMRWGYLHTDHHLRQFSR